eukprot:753482-Hanusia_phi.AAC.1
MGEEERVSLFYSAMDNLPFEDDTHDIAMSVSVLEHTTNYSRILSEMRRVLRPGGFLLLSFDVALRGDAQISVDDAEELLRVVQEVGFEEVQDGAGGRLREAVRREEEILTSTWAIARDPHANPWRSWEEARHLTVYCSVFRSTKSRSHAE